MLIAYDASGKILATLESLVVRDKEGHVVGLADFAATEAAGPLRQTVWEVEGAVGSGTWPEWVSASGYRVERDSEGRISALVHTSGARRERASVEAAIAARIAAADGAPANIRDLVGGPGRLLRTPADAETKGQRR